MTPVHLVIRVPAINVKQIVAEHNRIAACEGKVLMAKFGSVPGAANIQRMREQLIRGSPFSLILAAWKVGSVLGYVAPVRGLFTGDPPVEFRHLIPLYYQKIESGLWILLEGSFSEHSLEPYLLASNKKRLLDVLGIARTPTMLVEAVADQPE